MNMLKNMRKYLRTHHVIALLGLIVLVVAIMQYSGAKNGSKDGFGGGAGYRRSGDPRFQEPTPQQQKQVWGAADAGTAQPAQPAGQNEVFASAKGLSSPTLGLPPSCTKGAAVDPKDLLPKDDNSQWGSLNPAGSGDLKNVNLLQSGYHQGIDTVGSSLRNANLQVRSEPPNPTTKVSPWMNATIEPDLMRVPLEIGCGSQ
jgi:hypothetical protein